MAFELLPLKPEQHTVTFVPRLTLELPFFNLTFRHKNIGNVIKYEGRDEAGHPIRWEVYQDTSDEIGPPAVEAHEVWYLLVKPAIDSSRLTDGAIPEIIPLGGIRECLRKVGWTAGGHEARELIKALTQISFAGCVADLWIPTGKQDSEGKEHFLQVKGRFSRMSVYAIGEHHLTEEELAHTKFAFDLADVVYIRLDPLEAKLQQLQDRRILDNQYLFSLRPIARRWYELMAGKIFGVVTNRGEYCEIRYSWYIKHHHTLKRYYQRFRVVEQMNRVVRDHIASGYLRKVEYRAVKESDQELDYVIRYYPGPGATESNGRIQTFIRERRTPKKLRTASALRANAESVPVASVALTTTTQADVDTIVRLIVEFRISPSKACKLVLHRRDATLMQLSAWPFRNIKPNNQAGWMIQAIENNYEPPEAFRQFEQREGERRRLKAARDVIAACSFCDSNGFRRLKTDGSAHGLVRRCTHKPNIEITISPDAQNGTVERGSSTRRPEPA